MHRIFQNDVERQLYIDTFQTERLDYACNRYVCALETFFNGVWELRLKGMGLSHDDVDSDEDNDGGLRPVYWNHDEEDGKFLGPHEGRLGSSWDGSDEELEGYKLHPRCLQLDGAQCLDIHIKLADLITQPDGTSKTKWITLDQALDDAHNQFRAVMDRLMKMRHLIDSNHGRMNIFANARSISRCIRITVNVDYEVHVYDKNAEKPCPYHVSEPVGAIKD